MYVYVYAEDRGAYRKVNLPCCSLSTISYMLEFISKWFIELIVGHVFAATVALDQRKNHSWLFAGIQVASHREQP